MQNGTASYDPTYRIEVCYDNHWSILCGYDWNFKTAAVVCRQTEADSDRGIHKIIMIIGSQCSPIYYYIYVRECYFCTSMYYASIPFLGVAYTVPVSGQPVVSLGFTYTCNGDERNVTECNKDPIAYCQDYAEVQCLEGM